jgi:hypothetical protein
VFGIRVRAHGAAAPAVSPGRGVDTGVDIGPALLPVPAMAAGAWSSRGQIHGAPGTIAAPAPAPFPGYDTSPVAQFSTGQIGLPSSTLSGRWYPSVYFETDIPPRVGVVTLDNPHPFPVPAVRPNVGMVAKATNTPGGITPVGGSFLARYGGGWPIGWPRVVVNYPT